MFAGVWRVLRCLLLVATVAVPWHLPEARVVNAQSATSCILYGAQSSGPGALSRPLLELDPSTGAVVRAIGETGFGLTALAFNPRTGELFGTTGQAGADNFDRLLIRINRSTGAGTVVGPIGLGSGGIADLAFREDGTLFGWSESTDDLITINTTTGAGTIVGNAGISTRGSGLAFSSTGTLFLAGNNANGPLRTVNPASGLTTVGPTLTGAPFPTQPINALTFDENGTLFGVNAVVSGGGAGGPASLITINPANGQVTNRGTAISRLDAIEFACPLPLADFDAHEDEDDEDKKETEEQRQQRERTNRGGRADVSTEGNVLAVEEAPALQSLLVTIGVTRNERLVVQVPCVPKADVLACPDIKVGDYLEADGYQNGVGDENDYFVAVDDVEVWRHGKKVK